MLNCNFENLGCYGGYMVQAIDFLMQEGITTNQCLPYKNDKHTCTFRCDNQLDSYTKYYCKPGSIKIFTGIFEI